MLIAGVEARAEKGAVETEGAIETTEGTGGQHRGAIGTDTMGAALARARPVCIHSLVKPH